VYERLAFEWMDYTFFVEFGLKLAEGLNISLNKGKDIRYQIADDSPPPISGWSDLSEPVKMPDSFSEKIEESIIQPEIAQPQFIQPETRQPEFIQPEIRKPETSPDPNSFYGWMEQAKAAPPVQTDVDLSLLLDIPLEISIQLGKTKMKINELLKIREQSVVGLDSLADEPVEILVNNKLIAKGEVIVEGGKYGIRVLEVLSRADRIKSLR
ncbi:MAG: flagellar motor switch protein FliN, partial [Desulfatirhabdiaceae bacterium]